MKAQEILVARLDDIIFENRNKEYGAYLLRTSYDTNIAKSFWWVLGGTLIFLSTLAFLPKKQIAQLKIVEVDLMSKVKIEKDNEEPKLKEKPIAKVASKTIASREFTEPKIEADDKVMKEEVIATKEELKDVAISNETKEGIKEPNAIVEKPVISEEVKKVETPKIENKIETAVEEMPEFQNGASALLRYLSENIKYPAMAKETNIQGKVVLQFVVNEDGSISNIQSLKKIGGGCDEEAIRVVSNMPKWKPGKQGGRAVKVRFTLPIFFRLD